MSRLSASTRLTELIRGLEDPRNLRQCTTWPGLPQYGSLGCEAILSPADGVPHSLRAQIWPRLTRAFERKIATEVGNDRKRTPMTYCEVVRCSASLEPSTVRLIEKDLLRTMPSNVCFSTASAIGIPRLRRLLVTIAWLYTDIGYCQGLGVVSLLRCTLLTFR